MKNKKNVGIFIFDDVDILDFSGPYEVFYRARFSPGIESRLSNDEDPFKLFTVTQKYKTISASGGLKIIADFNFKNCPHIDILIIPGGFGTRKLLKNKITIQWIKNISNGASLVSSVCTGSLLLAKAGLLKGKKATTHWGALKLLKEISTSTKVISDQRVVEDGIITSAGVSSGIDMAFIIISKLLGENIASDTAKYIEFNRTNDIITS